MTTFFKKAMLYLGLGSDEDFLGMDPQGPSERPAEGGVIVKPTSADTNVKPITGDASGVKRGREAVTVTTAKPRKFVKPHIVTPCLLYTSPSPRDKRQSRMPSSA